MENKKILELYEEVFQHESGCSYGQPDGPDDFFKDCDCIEYGEEENALFTWCLEQASERYCGTLSQARIDILNSIEFPWAYYENELDKLGYHWKKNNPNGVRYNQE